MNNCYRLFFALVLSLIAAFADAQTSHSAAAGDLSSSAASAVDDKKSDASGSIDNKTTINDPLVQVLVAKGLLTVAEARSIVTTGTALDQRDRLAALLRNKGLISETEFEAVRTVASDSTASTPTTIPPTRDETREEPKSNASSQTAATPTKIAALAPVRLLGIDTPKREGLIPDIKLGTGARLKLYGIFKTSIIHDSSSPQGNDFPLPLLAGDTGPDASPEFHLRARGLRLGANFEWLDPAPKMVITGKLEFDFEGNFTRVNNRNISSIRSSQPSIRLAWVRIDRRFNDKTSAFALFGQDWSPFVSSTMPNMIENTNFGGPGYGAAYTRIPQARFGFNFKTSGSLQFQPEIAIVLPALGDLPANVADQLGFGERQGTDSQQPGVQGRAVLQWQLDKSENVPPAQFIVSFEHAKRTAIVTKAAVPTPFTTAFPSGAEVSSDSDAYSAEFQLPTHFITAVGKYYSGSDLRFYFAGQLLSNFNDTGGLTSTATASSIDGASTVVFGFLNGIPTIAPQRPVRGQGGFVQLGFPLSRIFDADPKGRNAGWTAYIYYGYDQATARDARRFGARGSRSDLFSGNIQYKLNQWVTFAYEQGYYRTRAANRAGITLLPLFRGIPSFTTHNIRSEFAAIFTF